MVFMVLLEITQNRSLVSLGVPGKPGWVPLSTPLDSPLFWICKNIKAPRQRRNFFLQNVVLLGFWVGGWIFNLGSWAFGLGS